MDVAVNAGKRSRTNPDGASPRANIKRPRRGEVNFLPSYPSGETRESLETRRLEMVEEFKKTSAERDIPLIHQHMMPTFALRREEIVTTSPPVSELKDRWPALFHETQLYFEFHRITNQNLPHVFYAALDDYAPQLIGLYKKRKTGRVGERMEQLLLAYGKQDKNDIYATRTAVLASLPMYLKEDPSEIFKTCKEENEFYEATIALVHVDEEEVPGGVPFSPRQVFIVLEDQVVMTHHSWNLDRLTLRVDIEGGNSDRDGERQRGGLGVRISAPRTPQLQLDTECRLVTECESSPQPIPTLT
uniref:uncharacterized protein LOC106676012 n=1 Tax=Maylandia zebra TaxID=106582 RepID=UPI000D323665|nr:uncharacterized protein LOC106676012 [Maylandia zebra]